MIRCNNILPSVALISLSPFILIIRFICLISNTIGKQSFLLECCYLSSWWNWKLQIFISFHLVIQVSLGGQIDWAKRSRKFFRKKITSTANLSQRRDTRRTFESSIVLHETIVGVPSLQHYTKFQILYKSKCATKALNYLMNLSKRIKK